MADVDSEVRSDTMLDDGNKPARSDIDRLLQRIERSGKVRLVQDIFGNEAVEVRPRWLPFWRRLGMTRKEAAAVGRVIRREAHVCPATGSVWLSPASRLTSEVPGSRRRREE